MFAASEARGENSLVFNGSGSMLCDVASYSINSGSGSISSCSCPTALGACPLPLLDPVTDDLRKYLLRVSNAVDLACDSKRKPDKLTISRLKEWFDIII